MYDPASAFDPKKIFYEVDAFHFICKKDTPHFCLLYWEKNGVFGIPVLDFASMNPLSFPAFPVLHVLDRAGFCSQLMLI